MKQKKKRVKKITNPKKRNSINAVDGWNEFLKDLKELEAKRKQRDLEFKSSIDQAKRNAAIDKLTRVVLNKLSDLFSEIEKEFTQDEINLIEERIEVPDSIGTYGREILKEHINNLLQLTITDAAFKKRIYSRIQGQNRSRGAKKKMFIPEKMIKPLYDLMEKGFSTGTSLKRLDLTEEQIKNYKNTLPKMAKERIAYAKNNPSFKNEPAYKEAIKILEYHEKNKGNRKPTK